MSTSIAEGERLVARGWRLGRLGAYLVQASIAVEHARGSDWARIVWLYDELMAVAPSPIVALNRAVAVAERDGPQAGLELMDSLSDLDGYRLFHAARADLLRRLSRVDEAADAYRAASGADRLVGGALVSHGAPRRVVTASRARRATSDRPGGRDGCGARGCGGKTVATTVCRDRTPACAPRADQLPTRFETCWIVVVSC